MESLVKEFNSFFEVITTIIKEQLGAKGPIFIFPQGLDLNIPLLLSISLSNLAKFEWNEMSKVSSL